jgi:tRNA dimethylallyltransferase
VIALLDGDITEAEARERTAQATRRFARRQDSWFRKDPRISWLRYDDPQLIEQALLVLRRRTREGGNPAPATDVVEEEGLWALDARG